MVQIEPAKDLAAMFNPPQGERYAGMRYGQGVILTFDPDTFENTVGFRGLTLTNVPILNGPDALTYQAGTVVALVGWAPNGGFGAWWILGRVITPGVGAAEQAIDFLQTALGAAVARGVIGESIFYDESIGSGSRTAFDTFGDLEGPLGGSLPPGPEVTFTLGGSKFIVIWGATFEADSTTGSSVQGYMSPDISGPSPEGPTIIAARTFSSGGDGGSFTQDSLAFSRVYTSMTPGEYTVTAKYRIDSGANVDDLTWLTRWLLVIAF